MVYWFLSEPTMKCDVCRKREALISIQQVMGKEKMELHLCDRCAKERGISTGGEKLELSLGSLLQDLMTAKRSEQPQANAVCPSCHRTVEEFTKTQKLGCTECAKAFDRELRDLMGKLGEPAQHLGKFPRRLKAYKTYLVDIARLKRGLKDAVVREDYEKAAVLRDKIRELETLSEA
jgi:protein arginine kinase activator